MLNDVSLLVVEDDPSNMQLLVFTFNMYEAKASYAQSGLEAIAALSESHEYDIILTDIQMPRMDGYALFREIRTRPAWSNIPIIALTANVMPNDRKLMNETGFDGFIEKPIDIEGLPDKILEVIEHWKKTHSTHPGPPPETPQAVSYPPNSSATLSSTP